MIQGVLIDINPVLKPSLTGIGIYTGELLRYFNSQDSSPLRWGVYYDRTRRIHAGNLTALTGADTGQLLRNGIGCYCGINREFGRFMAPWVDLQSWIHLIRRKWRVFHATNILVPLLPAGIKSVLTVHDLLFYRFPQFETPYMLRRWKSRLGQAIRRADSIIAVSEATAGDLQHYYHVDTRKIRVVYHGVDDGQIRWVTPAAKAAVRERWNLPERFLLFVGTISAHKNVLNLVKAFSEIDQPDVGLVIVGKSGADSGAVESFLAGCPQRSRVRLLGYLPPEDLEAIYQLATIFVFPSLHEGFGLPVLEAMKRRLPVVTSNNSSLREVFKDSAVLVNPTDPAEMAKTITALLNDETGRASMIQKGEEYARTFSWKRTGEQTRAVYESFL